ncbi:L,D-transpeptidase family protein [Bradyrhizobium tropiciagri]|uniref:L,D-transpeptidase family protein n=1 Tax=Bradyrhizobium tropiciagri TaxID=312253 RepID=UPI001BADF7C9|nr:L,D-transpeptidase [Bradyrhizobium tropiciagri]MBR0897561.1 L,D-transpeptidase family protein [Bradyrhizobium tropiciagri]
MMINRILTICAAAALGVAGTSLAHAQQGYPAPQGQVYSAAPQPYSQGNMPDFDATDDEDAPRNSAALPPPGPVMSPDDPRYGRPMNAPPVYSERAPTGPVMSPDDPRYGRPMGPPPVIYGDRAPGGGPQQAYRDNGVPAAGVSYGDDRGGMRPPEGVTGAVPPQQAPVDANGKPVQIAALPPDEQPEDGPAQLAPNLRRQEVAFATKEPAGTIVVDTPNTYLYYVLGNGRAIRYGVRVGRDGFTWTGVQKITRKAEWPDWHPPTEMIERQPYLPRFMAGGPGNPLGARAMYLGSTVYRIHGTNQPSTIGKFVSSGCIGMLNEDVSDLFDRAKVGTRVVVLPGGSAPGTTTASAAPPPNPMAPAQAAPLPGTQPTSVQPLPAPVTVR